MHIIAIKMHYLQIKLTTFNYLYFNAIIGSIVLLIHINYKTLFLILYLIENCSNLNLKVHMKKIFYIS